MATLNLKTRINVPGVKSIFVFAKTIGINFLNYNKKQKNFYFAE